MSDNQPDRDAELDAERDELTKISELSKRGYQYLKENLLNEAESCFQEIFAYDEKNNYALVGQGDIARKKRKHRDAIK